MTKLVLHIGPCSEDGRLTEVLEAGRYELPTKRWWVRRAPQVEIVLVDMREREITIKGQEILTADKVALRVSIITQFKVTDPVAALESVADYEDRLYSDVQLAARRSLATMQLADILTNRNQLSEAALVEARTKAEQDRIETNARTENDRVSAQARREATLLAAQAEAEAERIRTDAEVDALTALGANAEARLYVGFDKHVPPDLNNTT